MKQALPATQSMRQAPSEAVASLAPQPDVIVEHPGREEEEERKTGGPKTPAQRAAQAQPAPQLQRGSSQAQSLQQQQPARRPSDPSHPTIQPVAQQPMAPQYAGLQNTPSPGAPGTQQSPTPQGPSTIDHDSVSPPAGDLNSQSRIKVTLTQEGQKVHVDDGMMGGQQEEPGPTLSGG